MSNETMPCLICDKPLESVGDDWSSCQPYGGCELQIIGSYGSTKFDSAPGSTTYRGVICDECAETVVARMGEPECRDFHGKIMQADDPRIRR